MTTPDIASTATLEPKARLNGKILKTTLAGALVDVGQSIPGVIHISQLSKDPVNKVEDVIKEGQTVDVWVRRVKKDRIELTMIQPLALEWKEIEPDKVVKGKVVRLEARADRGDGEISAPMLAGLAVELDRPGEPGQRRRRRVQRQMRGIGSLIVARRRPLCRLDDRARAGDP